MWKFIWPVCYVCSGIIDNLLTITFFVRSTPEETVEEEKEPEPEKDEEEMEMEAENAEMDELETLLENQNKEELQNMKRLVW